MQAEERPGNLNFRFQIRDHVKEALVEAAVAGDGFLDGDVGDVQAAQNGDPAPLLVMHHVDGMQAVTLAQSAVVGGGNAATLRVPQVH